MVHIVTKLCLFDEFLYCLTTWQQAVVVDSTEVVCHRLLSETKLKMKGQIFGSVVRVRVRVILQEMNESHAMGLVVT